MANHLVTARIRLDRLDELEERLCSGNYDELPGMRSDLVDGLRHALMLTDTIVVWEENLPTDDRLRNERDATVAQFFSVHTANKRERGSGWEMLREFPRLFPDL
ncbi:MAG: hypothetical protein JW863_18425 [Chitinispirillaceae bacterium]|nr:hypothetical protein [Chitinispirillaceae bacterium]